MLAVMVLVLVVVGVVVLRPGLRAGAIAALPCRRPPCRESQPRSRGPSFVPRSRSSGSAQSGGSPGASLRPAKPLLLRSAPANSTHHHGPRCSRRAAWRRRRRPVRGAAGAARHGRGPREGGPAGTRLTSRRPNPRPRCSFITVDTCIYCDREGYCSRCRVAALQNAFWREIDCPVRGGGGSASEARPLTTFPELEHRKHIIVSVSLV